MTTESILRTEEGKSLTLYKDTEGILTIGVGYNIQKRGLPDDIVEELFRRDLMALRADASKLPEYAKLDVVRQGVLERMVFQMGVDGVMAFTNTRKCIAAQDWAGAAAGIRGSKWGRIQTPARANREANRMLRGIE
jgi:lysozyme